MHRVFSMLTLVCSLVSTSMGVAPDSDMRLRWRCRILRGDFKWREKR